MSPFHSPTYLLTGVDEAGRGALAGPVVAASAVASSLFSLPGLADSKLLTEKQREALFARLTLDLNDFAYCAIDHEIVDSINIRQATLEAMRRSHLALKIQTQEIIIDGCDAPILGSRAQIKADRDVAVVSAASIIAKVVRDRLMNHYHSLYPIYRFDKHKGYPTELHRSILAQYGPSPIHRLTYKYKVVPHSSELLA